LVLGRQHRISAEIARTYYTQFALQEHAEQQLLAWEQIRFQEKAARVSMIAVGPRSEEHTSELQSRENLVCRLLLEKKKKRARGVKPDEKSDSQKRLQDAVARRTIKGRESIRRASPQHGTSAVQQIYRAARS